MTCRTARGLPLFHSERDAVALLELLQHTTRDVARWELLAYCFMPNHMHYIVDAEVDQLSLAMQRLNGLYAQRFNRVHGYRGHLFQGRFHAKAIEDEAHLPASLRYLALNPVRAGLCARPENWRWSSYRASIGLASAPPFLSVERALACFGTDEHAARAVFRRFVDAELIPSSGPGTVPGTVPIGAAG